MIDTADTAVSRVLDPVSLPCFFEEHWEREPLHIARGNNQWFSSLLQIQQLESMLSTQELRYPHVQLSRKLEPVAPEAYTDEAERIVPLRLIEQHRAGATIVVSQAQRLIESLSVFRRHIQSAFGLRCQTNLYLSPPGQQGFNAHYDSHDVFILQVQGSKIFNFYEGGVQLPYSDERFDPAVHVAGELTESVLVNAGDTLYIPRGVMHDAVADATTSLHITLGVYALSLRDVLMEMIDVLTAGDQQYRRSLPMAGFVPQRGAAATESALDESALEMPPELQAVPLTVSLWQSAVARLADEVALDSAQQCEGLLSKPVQILAVADRVRVKSGRPLSAQRQGDTVHYRVPGQVLEFKDPLGRALEQLLAAVDIQLPELDGLDDDQRVALCEPLLQANVIEILQKQDRTQGAFDEHVHHEVR